MYANVRSLCSTPETNIAFYINCISLKNKTKPKENTDPLGWPQRDSREAASSWREVNPSLQENIPQGLSLMPWLGPRLPSVHSLDFGRHFQAPHTRSWELPGVDVGDLLEGTVDISDVITFHHQDGLRGVEMILEDRGITGENGQSCSQFHRDPPSAYKGHGGISRACGSAAAVCTVAVLIPQSLLSSGGLWNSPL